MYLEEALRTIRSTCERYATCEQCPLRSRYDSCGIKETTPNNWELKSDGEDLVEEPVFCQDV